MGVITKDRFDPINAYVNVRLQQGVPLVDADVNELDDIRKFEVRAFLKWFVGNGVPEGNDGFRIDATGAADDFQISVGAQSAGSLPSEPGAERNNALVKTLGRCIVDGLDAMIRTPIKYKEQPLFSSSDAPTKLEAPKVDGIPVPAAPGPGLVLVYLDVWERVVKPADEPRLIVPPLGTESCARMKREWVVRTRLGTTVPVDGESDFRKGHSYYGLALINRRLINGSPAPILQSDITDLREQRLLIPPSTLITDVLGGTAVDYRRGVNRPAISLREALNALVREEVPTTVERGLPHSGNVNELSIVSNAVAFDRQGGVNVLWSSVRTDTNTYQVLTARLDPARPEAGFVLPSQPQVASGPAMHFEPHAAMLPTGDIVVAYVAFTSTQVNVFFKRATDVGSLSAAPEQPIRNPTGSQRSRHPHVVVVPAVGGGGYVIFFWREDSGAGAGTGTWMFRRRQYGADWAEGTARWAADPGVLGSLATLPDSTSGFHAAVGADRSVWVAYQARSNETATDERIQPVKLKEDGTLTTPPVIANLAVRFGYPFVLIDNSGLVWVFFEETGAGGSIRLQQYRSQDASVVLAAAQIPGTVSSYAGFGATASIDVHGGVWMFWRGNFSILSARWSPLTRTWGVPRPLSASTSTSSWGSNGALVVARSPEGALWLFRQTFPDGGVQNILGQQILNEL